MADPLKISNVSHAFGDRLVLEDVEFSVKKNQIFGFVGLNGVGKTTLIKIILDLIEQNSGLVEIFGVNKILPQSRKNIFYLPEKFSPSPYLKGEEFLRFVLNFHNAKLDIERLRALCDSLDFSFEMLNYKVTKYSKGMVQKLGLIATFLSQAELVILDEPMSGLDPKARIKLKRELLDYKNQGKTIFFSSHILSDMDEICDEIALLNERKIIFSGSPKSLKEKHAKNDLEQAFLHEINL